MKIFNKNIGGGKIRFVVLAVLLVSFSISNATEYTIASASDLNSLGTLQPGDIVKMKSGTWTNQILEFYGNGTEAEPITLTVETEKGVILNGTSRLRIAGEYMVVDGLRFEGGALTGGTAIVEFRENSSNLAYNCRITNSTFIDYNVSNIDTDYKWLGVYGESNRVDHCHFENKTHSGTTLVVWTRIGYTSKTQIDHNYFGSRPDLGFNGGETIRIGDSSTSMNYENCIVEYNVFEECDGEIEIISNKSCGNIYRYNTFRNNEGTLTIRHGNDCEVYGNYFFDSMDKRSGGVRIIGEDHKVYNNYFEGLNGSNGFRSAISLVNGRPNSALNGYFRVINALVINNTIVNCARPLTVGVADGDNLTEVPLDCIIANNVIDDVINAVTFETRPENMLWEGNIFNSAAPLDSDLEGGAEQIDPQLEMVGELFKLKSTSPAINASQDNYSFITHDFDGQEREGIPDVGADEYSTAEITIKPLTKDEVGPYPNDPPTAIDKVKYDNDFITITQSSNSFGFYVKNQTGDTVSYCITDISGSVVDQGDMLSSKEISLKKGSMYIAVFKSGDGKKLQKNKLVAL